MLLNFSDFTGTLRFQLSTAVAKLIICNQTMNLKKSFKSVNFSNFVLSKCTENYLTTILLFQPLKKPWQKIKVGIVQGCCVSCLDPVLLPRHDMMQQVLAPPNTIRERVTENFYLS